jgi:uncharacterized protein (TIGR02646 family)
MIKVEKDLKVIPNSLQDADCKNSLTIILAAGNGEAINDEIYQGNKNNKNADGFGDVQQALKDLYHNKCAYCESPEFKPQIEHYRPKKGLKTKNSVLKWKKATTHKGYYWLCYEWSNLLPSCADCNGFSGKGTKFPLLDEAKRIFIPSSDNKAETLNMAEQPYLLHPEIDEPKNFFRFDDKGNIFGTDTQGRGEMTIEICWLRDNQTLRFNRQDQVFDYYLTVLVEALNLPDDDSRKSLVKKIIEKLYRDLQNPKKSFRLYRWYFYTHFKELLVAPLLPQSEIDFVVGIYEEFYKENPA